MPLIVTYLLHFTIGYYLLDSILNTCGFKGVLPYFISNVSVRMAKLLLTDSRAHYRKFHSVAIPPMFVYLDSLNILLNSIKPLIEKNNPDL